jgi:hypothetical protein
LGIAGKFLVRQEFEQDNSLGFMYDLLGEERFVQIPFFYRPTEEKKLEASISFHITQREKVDVLRAIYHPSNLSSLEQLKALLQSNEQQLSDWELNSVE